MIQPCPWWKTFPPFHEGRSVLLKWWCTVCLEQCSTEHITSLWWEGWSGGWDSCWRLWASWVLARAMTEGPTTHSLAHVSFLGPAVKRVSVLLLSGSFPEILLSFPFFFGNSAAGTTLCWVSSVTFQARTADKYSNHANNRHIPKSCRAVAATTCWEQTPRASSRT